MAEPYRWARPQRRATKNNVTKQAPTATPCREGRRELHGDLNDRGVGVARGYGQRQSRHHTPSLGFGIRRQARDERSEPVAAAIDLLPTLAQIAGTTIGDPAHLDGTSLAPLLLGAATAEDWPEREILSFWRGRVSVRTQHHRLDTEGRLFDIPLDPGQRIDVTDDEMTEVRRLRDLSAAWATEMLLELGATDERPFHFGGAPRTWLPARDGRVAGGVSCSNRFPNSSHFTNWTHTADRIHWPVEVVRPGRYRVGVEYTCSQVKLGSRVELRLGGQKLAAQVDVAHDPVIFGPENGRFPRQESAFKRFALLELGTIELAGQGDLELRATDIPGGWVMEVAALR
ncbi:MAG: hypothetical protein VYE73_09570 [Acidobacteriota bacterium]|nr:hypothetical protein [Acidobacteriota bacterium]